MAHLLTFQIRQSFRTTQTGITIPFSLARGELTASGNAKIDTGSEYCLFQRELAEALGIEVEDGLPVRLETLTGGLTAYGHTVQLNTFGVVFESAVLFTPAYGVSRNILGRRGWLENLHLALTMDDETIYLRPAYSPENV